MSANGSHEHLLIADATQASWSGSGRRFAFVRSEGKDEAEVWIANADGKGRRGLSGTSGIDDQPAWGSGGIAFVSRRTGRPQVFVMRPNGTHERPVAPQDADQGSPCCCWGKGCVAFISDATDKDEPYETWLPNAYGHVSPILETASGAEQIAVGDGTQAAVVVPRPGGGSRLDLVQLKTSETGAPHLEHHAERSRPGPRLELDPQTGQGRRLSPRRPPLGREGASLTSRATGSYI